LYYVKAGKSECEKERKETKERTTEIKMMKKREDDKKRTTQKTKKISIDAKRTDGERKKL